MCLENLTPEAELKLFRIWKRRGARTLVSQIN
jgi:hypothetical protein